MKNSQVKAVVVASEISLNKLALHFGIDKKFRWEDPLILKDNHLKGILGDPKKKFVYIFYFGTIVFINFEHHEIMDVINYLKGIEKSINFSVPFKYEDDYNIIFTSEEPPSINYDTMVAPTDKDYYTEILSIILAKSVALEKIENEIDILLDEIEEMIDFLNKGNLSISDERLAKLSGKILGFKYSTLSYIMVLDKPDITWIYEDAEELFTELSGMFDLNDRYENIRHKIETLMDITEVFTTLTHAKRSTRLEWMIIWLIFFEIIFSLLDKFVF